MHTLTRANIVMNDDQYDLSIICYLLFGYYTRQQY